MGVVYLAENRLMGRDEVLKVIEPQIVDGPGSSNASSARFGPSRSSVTPTSSPPMRRPARREHRLRHGIRQRPQPGQVVKARGPLPVADAWHYIQQAALGLQHAHEHRMVHRDIKPSNLMLTRQGGRDVIKVLDFGLAKVQARGRRTRADPRGPDAGHARLHRTRANSNAAAGRHPSRHLQPGLHPLLPPGRRPAIPEVQPL